MSKMGRPKIQIDWEQAAALMRLRPTLEDSAAFFKCSPTTFSDRLKAETGLTFREFRDQNFVHTRLQLVRDAIKMAKKNPTMMIFCLKNLNNWTNNDQLEITNTDKKVYVNVFENENPVRKDEEAG